MMNSVIGKTVRNVGEFWKDRTRQLQLLKQIEQSLKIQRPSDWYKYKDYTIGNWDHRAGVLLKQYNNSLGDLLSTLYPEVPWDKAIFSDKPRKQTIIAKPRNYWKDKSNQLTELKELEQKLRIKEAQDWYKIGFSDMIQHKGSSILLSQFDYSLRNMLSTFYPAIQWDEARLKQKLPRNYWKDKSNQLQALRELEEKLNIKEPTDWYTRNYQDVIQHKGEMLIRQYKGSLSAMLSSLYPDIEWDINKFQKLPHNYWKEKSNQKKFLEQLQTKLNLNGVKDWMKYVSTQDIQLHGGSGLLAHYGSVVNLYKSLTSIKEDEAEYSWWLSQGKGKAQGRIEQLVKQVFEAETISNYQLKVDGQRGYELDVYIPSLRLAFEYQGEQHYQPTIFGNIQKVKTQQERDRRKQQICKEKKIILVEVPYWKKDNIQSLLECIVSITPITERSPIEANNNMEGQAPNVLSNVKY